MRGVCRSRNLELLWSLTGADPNIISNANTQVQIRIVRISLLAIRIMRIIMYLTVRYSCNERTSYNMSEKMMFAILGIDKTKDEETIRNAYRELLQNTHPEENPEGFKRLREAYEGALK